MHPMKHCAMTFAERPRYSSTYISLYPTKFRCVYAWVCMCDAFEADLWERARPLSVGPSPRLRAWRPA